MFLLLGDDLVVKILSVASAWPHSSVRRTCARFNQLSDAFRAAAIEAGIDETLVVATSCGVWLLNQERECWMQCAPPPVDDLSVTYATTCGGEVYFAYCVFDEDRDMCWDLIAFDCTRNTWRDVELPDVEDDFYDIEDISTLHDRLVVSTSHRVRHMIFDDDEWTPLPDVPLTDEFATSLRSIASGVVDDKLYVWHAKLYDQARTVTRVSVYANGEWTDVVTRADDRDLAEPLGLREWGSPVRLDRAVVGNSACRSHWPRPTRKRLPPVLAASLQKADAGERRQRDSARPARRHHSPALLHRPRLGTPRGRRQGTPHRRA